MRTIPTAMVLATLAVPALADEYQTQPVPNKVPLGACLSVWPVDGHGPLPGQAWVGPDGTVIQANIRRIDGELYFQRCEHGKLSRAFQEDGTSIR